MTLIFFDKFCYLTSLIFFSPTLKKFFSVRKKNCRFNSFIYLRKLIKVVEKM